MKATTSDQATLVFFGFLAGVVVSFAFIAITSLYLLFYQSSEAYEQLSTLALNVTKPKTAWMNMGIWTDQADNPDDELSLPQAAERLARELHAHAHIPKHGKILDVGCGMGESMVLLCDTYQPEVIHGVTTLHSHARHAQSLLKKRQVPATSTPRHSATTSGSAAKSQIWTDDILQWLKTCPTQDRYDTILALDCAYHFASRSEYIRLASQKLEPGGCLAFFDLLASYPPPPPKPHRAYRYTAGVLPLPQNPPTAWSWWRHRFSLFLLGVPVVNFWSVDEYVDRLVEYGGFEASGIHVVDVTSDVFPGFARFLKAYGRGETSWRGGSMVSRFALAKFANVVARWGRGGDEGLVRAAIVVAFKNQEPNTEE